MTSRFTFAPISAALLSALLLTACSGYRSASRAPESETGAGRPNQAVLWVQDSAEYRVALEQTYRFAGEQLAAQVGDREAGTWAVSMDADETIISNLGYSLRRAHVGGLWTEESWHEWVQAREATAIPGALGFIERVHALGGKIAVVTNRSVRDCPATRDNLDALGVPYDTILCRGDDEAKDERWRQVEAGEGTGLEPLEIVMWIGDNIFDFPGMSQESRTAESAALEPFGRRYFLLPNPIYGSWESF